MRQHTTSRDSCGIRWLYGRCLHTLVSSSDKLPWHRRPGSTRQDATCMVAGSDYSVTACIDDILSSPKQKSKWLFKQANSMPGTSVGESIVRLDRYWEMLRVHIRQSTVLNYTCSILCTAVYTQTCGMFSVHKQTILSVLFHLCTQSREWCGRHTMLNAKWMVYKENQKHIDASSKSPMFWRCHWQTGSLDSRHRRNREQRDASKIWLDFVGLAWICTTDISSMLGWKVLKCVGDLRHHYLIWEDWTGV